MIEAKVLKNGAVRLKLGKGDYNIIRLLLEDQAKQAHDPNTRDYLSTILLPTLPKVQ